MPEGIIPARQAKDRSRELLCGLRERPPLPQGEHLQNADVGQAANRR
jgi:hypothetical protein